MFRTHLYGRFVFTALFLFSVTPCCLESRPRPKIIFEQHEKYNYLAGDERMNKSNVIATVAWD